MERKQQIATLTQQVVDQDREQLTKLLMTDVLTGQRLQMRRRGNCFHCGQPGHYKSKCPLRVKNVAPAVDTGILGDALHKPLLLDVVHGALKIDKEVFLLRDCQLLLGGSVWL